MFNADIAKKGNFLEQTKAAREERAQEKRKDVAATSIQAFIRGWLARKRFTRDILESFDTTIITEGDKSAKSKSALQLYQAATRLLLVIKLERDKERFEKLCSILVESLNLDSKRNSYVGVALSREHAIPWIAHVKKLLWQSCLYLDQLSPDFAPDSRSLLLHLRVLVAFTSTASWAILKDPDMERLRPGMNKLCANVMGDLFTKGFYKILERLLVKGVCGPKVVLQNVALTAIINLAIRPLVSAGFSNKLLSLFLIHILSVPAMIYHLSAISPESISTLVSHKILPRSVKLLSEEQDLRIVFNALEGNYALCLLANIVQMANIEREGSLKEIYYPDFTHVVTRLLASCQRYVTNKQSNLTHWHPVLGWFAQYLDPHLHSSLPLVRRQLSMLWGAPLASILLADLAPIVESAGPPIKVEASEVNSVSFTSLCKALLSDATKSDKKYSKLGTPDFVKVSRMAALYQTTLGTLTQLRLDILTGLCYQNNVVHLLWRYLCTLGPGCGMTMFLDLLSHNPEANCPEFQLLILFCDCMTHYVTILDDIEMYEQQTPFKLEDFVFLSDFLNQFLYKGLLEELFAKKLGSNTLFQSAHTLLMMLYRRDSIRQYTPQYHWLIRDMSVRSFINELDKGKNAYQVLLQKMPHIIPQEERVQLFRRYVANEKSVMGISDHGASSTLITIHRSRIVEDGYRQLALLPSAALKGVIRVRFVNEQGLFEAGIDQDGVFKEFLEETVKRVFDPSLNLFRVTSEERLYPSPTSSLQDNYLQLFEFVGRMIGKAVYEGIVVDVPFASFFLSQLLGSQHQAFYSAIDELPSLDAELYRSLTYIKHHEGDVTDLELTFSIDQDYLGKLQTFELVPGGRAIPVNNENKINYIHLMAHFRMHTQIREQTAAFMRGFRSLINIEWLSLFSTPELQRMISGDNAPLDLKDLRRHTHYYGGFHDSHRVIGWLWDVLAKDFSEPEKRQFLKFVTSCSKPPLLGFANLEPPFSIRCVEVSDDDDTGDTIGSVIRGFFTIRKKDPQNRLPTSSTCFNLLKLPNYQRKSTLRDKLRYAISSNTGFELS